MTLPKTEQGFVDIMKYIYDTLSNYVPIIQMIGPGRVRTNDYNNYWQDSDIVPMIYITMIGSTTDYGIRSELYQIDVFTKTYEENVKLKEIVIDLFNRRNHYGIRSKLERNLVNTEAESGEVRSILDFEFVVHDPKY